MRPAPDSGCLADRDRREGAGRISARPDPFRPPDDEARDIALRLMQAARVAALAVLREGAPYVARVAFGRAEDGAPLTLVSDLSHHTAALRQNPAASLLIGEEPDGEGDPLTRPRMTLQARACFVAKTAHRDPWLAQHPRSKLYVDFADFHSVRFELAEAHLNAGFGRAYQLAPSDLGL